METSIVRYVRPGYIDSNIHPLTICGLNCFDMIDIMQATKVTNSYPDSWDQIPNNDHIKLINSHIIYFQETGFYQKRFWCLILFPYIQTCLINCLMRKPHI